MVIKTHVYGICPLHSDCTVILRSHEGKPTKAEQARFEVETDDRYRDSTTYRLTVKARTA